jgi:hypothetical protein
MFYLLVIIEMVLTTFIIVIPLIIIGFAIIFSLTYGSYLTRNVTLPRKRGICHGFGFFALCWTFLKKKSNSLGPIISINFEQKI